MPLHINIAIAGQARRQHGSCSDALILANSTESHRVMFDKLSVPIVPLSRRHRLVGIIERGFAECMIVPFNAGYFTGLTSDACCHIDVFADFVGALRALAGYRSGMGRDFLNLHCSFVHARPALLKPFQV